MKERREQPNQKTNPTMITSAKNYTKKKPQNGQTEPQEKCYNKAILTKSHKEAYRQTLTKREKGKNIHINI